MAISYVGGQVGGRAGSTSTLNVTFSFTGGTDSTPQPGDLVVITIAKASSNRNTSQSLAGQGYEVAVSQLYANFTNDTSLIVNRKFMGTTPDTQVTIPSTGDAADAQTWAIQCFRGVDGATPSTPTRTAVTAGNTTAVNPPAITPTNSGTWLTIHGAGSAGASRTYTAPTDYATNFLQTAAADTNDSSLGVGYYTGWTSGSYDPGAFGGGTVLSGTSYAAATVPWVPGNNYPTITSQPQSVTGFVGMTEQFTVEVTVIEGNPESYQWQVSTNGGSTWTNVSTGTGGTSTTYTTETITGAMNGYQYRVVVIADAALGGNMTVSSAATLSVITYLGIVGAVNIMAAINPPIEAKVSWIEMEVEKSQVDEKVKIYIVD